MPAGYWLKNYQKFMESFSVVVQYSWELRSFKILQIVSKKRKTIEQSLYSISW